MFFKCQFTYFFVSCASCIYFIFFLNFVEYHSAMPWYWIIITVTVAFFSRKWMWTIFYGLFSRYCYFLTVRSQRLYYEYWMHICARDDKWCCIKLKKNDEKLLVVKVNWFQKTGRNMLIFKYWIWIWIKKKIFYYMPL